MGKTVEIQPHQHEQQAATAHAWLRHMSQNHQPAGTETLGSLGGFFAWVGDADSNASALPAPSVSFIICIQSKNTF
jgi:hypothetical protein